MRRSVIRKIPSRSASGGAAATEQGYGGAGGSAAAASVSIAGQKRTSETRMFESKRKIFKAEKEFFGSEDGRSELTMGSKDALSKQANTAYEGLTDEQKGLYVKNAMRYIFLRKHSKNLQIKRGDLDLPDAAKTAKPRIFAEARILLDKMFGIRVVEVPNVRAHDIGTGKYIAISQLPPHTDEDEKKIRYGVLMTTLSYVFMKNGRAGESGIVEFFKKDPIKRTEKKVKRDLKRFVDEGYLEKIQSRSGGSESYDYKFGLRSKVEVTLENVAEFVCKIMGKEDVGRILRNWLNTSRGDFE